MWSQIVCMGSLRMQRQTLHLGLGVFRASALEQLGGYRPAVAKKAAPMLARFVTVMAIRSADQS